MNEPANPTPSNQKKLILKAISGEIALPPVSRMYVIGVVFTASAILLLPLLYLAVMGLVLGGLLALIQRADALLVDWQPFLKWSAIGTIIVLGAACILGLIKPFFARSATVNRPRALHRDTEPFLYEYIDRLCKAIGARPPTDIHVTCDMNAAAEFRNGWQILSSNRDVSLYLGLPMIAGLTLRQFTGVLAHELGHFTQRTAMWLENIVRRTNFWFYRAAYERDWIDEWLTTQCSTGGPLSIPCHLACAVVWMTRRVLLALAEAGTVIGCLMSRQMEFNADRCQIRIVGSRTLASTLRRMRELSLAHQISFRDIAIFLDEGRLPDDMVALVMANTAFITPKMKKKMRRMIAEETTGLLDSHPSDQDRIVAASADGASGFIQPGTLPDYLPASILFDRFDEVSKSVTTQFLENALQQKIKPRMLHPVEKLLERQNVQIDAAKALWRYFQTEIPLLRPLPIAAQSAEAPENPREIANELKVCRARMMNELPEYKRLTQRYRAAEETLFETFAAQSLFQAQLPFKPADYHLIDITAGAIADKQSRAKDGVATLAGKMLPFETEAGGRLSFALQLIHVPVVVRKIVDGDELQFEVRELLPQAKYVSQLMGELPSLRMIVVRLQTLGERLKETPSNQAVSDVIASQLSTLRSRLSLIQSDLGDRLYPFDHAQAETTLCEYMLPHLPGDGDLAGIVEAYEHMQSRLITMQARLFARLALAAEKIEAAIGLPPLPEPQRDADE
jgi:Zn-dependent protease with chaperone function